MDLLPAFCAFVEILLFVAGKKENTVLDFSHLSQKVPAEKLRCYNCQDNHHGCQNLVNFSHVPVSYCSLDQPHCMVTRLESEGKLIGFSRNCSSECSPGCKNSVSYTKCVSCCNTSRCNTDSKASFHCKRTLFILVMCVSVCVWMLKG